VIPVALNELIAILHSLLEFDPSETKMTLKRNLSHPRKLKRKYDIH
jgi:hypothetical protein